VNAFDYIHRGGPIMYLLLVANFISYTIILWKWFSLRSEKKNISVNAENLLTEIKKEGGENSLNYAKERISHYVHKLEQGLDWVKIIASTSPLLGLLGTVLGILVAFETISTHGLGKPEFFAQGIAMALITTAGGLLVAIPNSIFYNLLMSSLNNIEFKLENNLIPRLENKD